MASSIRLTNTGAPETPPAGYARIFVEEYNNRLYLKMKRPDGSVQVFGTINLPLEVDMGGTGLSQIPQVGQFLIGTGTGYRIGDIVAGPGVNIVKTETSFEISTDISNIELQMPSEFLVNEDSVNGQNTFVVTKATQNQHTVYAGPSASNGIPTFRFLQVEDIPNLPITKIIGLIETIRSESLLVPVDSADIDHTYDSTAKTLSSTIKATSVTAGTYGSGTTVPTFTVRPDGRLSAASNVEIAIPHTQITNFTEATQDVVGALAKNSISINAEYDDYNNSLKFHVNEEHLITTNVSDTENQRAPTSQAIKQYIDDLTIAERNARITQDTALQAAINILETQVGSNLQQIISDLNLALYTESNARIAEDNELQTAISSLETQVGTNLQQALQNINTSISDEIAARTSADLLLNQRLNSFFQNAPTVLDTIVEISQRFEAIEETIRNGLSVSTELLADQLTTVNSQIDLIQADLDAEVTTRIQEIADLNQKVDRGLIIPDYEITTITQTDVENNYILLSSNTIIPKSVTASLDRVMLFEEIDFVIEALSNGTSKLSFTSNISIDIDEVLKVNYLYSESLDCNISANYENFVITQQDIDNGYLYLTNSKLLPESITAFVDRIPLLQGIDFLVTRLVNNIYKLTFIGDILPQETLALEPGENIRVNYLCRA